jgi:hypothetical protein
MNKKGGRRKMVITRKNVDIAAAQHLLNLFSVYLLWGKILICHGLWECQTEIRTSQRSWRCQLPYLDSIQKSKNPHLVTRYTSQYFSLPLCPLSDTSVDLSSRFLLSIIQIFLQCSAEVYSKKYALDVTLI